MLSGQHGLPLSRSIQEGEVRIRSTIRKIATHYVGREAYELCEKIEEKLCQILVGFSFEVLVTLKHDVWEVAVEFLEFDDQLNVKVKADCYQPLVYKNDHGCSC